MLQELALGLLLNWRVVHEEVVRSVCLRGYLLRIKTAERCHVLVEQRLSLRVERLIQVILDHHILSRLLLFLRKVTLKIRQILPHLRDLLLIVGDGVLEHVGWYA